MPEPGAATPPPERVALRDALAYLLDEVAMLRVPLARLPALLQTEAPAPGVPSLRETYALLAARDEARTAALLTSEAWPDEPSIPEGAAEHPTDALLDRVAAAREALLATLDALPEARWAEAAPRLHRAVLDDAALLRSLAERLHDAHGLGGA